MSSDKVELVRQGYEAWNSGDRQWVLNHLTEDVEWETPPEDPEAGIFRGHAGVQGFWDSWRELVGQLTLEVQKVYDDENHVVVIAKRIGIGEISGVEVADQVIQAFSFNDEGLCFRVQEFYDEKDALKSIGVDPDSVEPTPVEPS